LVDISRVGNNTAYIYLIAPKKGSPFCNHKNNILADGWIFKLYHETGTSVMSVEDSKQCKINGTQYNGASIHF
jgi:hypothetical protein